MVYVYENKKPPRQQKKNDTTEFGITGFEEELPTHPSIESVPLSVFLALFDF